MVVYLPAPISSAQSSGLRAIVRWDVIGPYTAVIGVISACGHAGKHGPHSTQIEYETTPTFRVC